MKSCFQRKEKIFFLKTLIFEKYYVLGDNDGDINNEIDKAELNNVIKTLGSKLEDLQTCHDLIVKHGLALQRSLNELDSSFNR